MRPRGLVRLKYPAALSSSRTNMRYPLMRLVTRISYSFGYSLFSLQAQDWIFLEFTSRAIDSDIHNITLVTPRLGRMLTFNFNSTKADFPRMEAALRKSIRSIVLEEVPGR